MEARLHEGKKESERVQLDHSVKNYGEKNKRGQSGSREVFKKGAPDQTHRLNK